MRTFTDLVSRPRGYAVNSSVLVLYLIVRGYDPGSLVVPAGRTEWRVLTQQNCSGHGCMYTAHNNPMSTAVLKLS